MISPWKYAVAMGDNSAENAFTYSDMVVSGLNRREAVLEAYDTLARRPADFFTQMRSVCIVNIAPSSLAKRRRQTRHRSRIMGDGRPVFLSLNCDCSGEKSPRFFMWLIRLKALGLCWYASRRRF